MKSTYRSLSNMANSSWTNRFLLIITICASAVSHAQALLCVRCFMMENPDCSTSVLDVREFESCDGGECVTLRTIPTNGLDPRVNRGCDKSLVGTITTKENIGTCQELGNAFIQCATSCRDVDFCNIGLGVPCGWSEDGLQTECYTGHGTPPGTNSTTAVTSTEPPSTNSTSTPNLPSNSTAVVSKVIKATTKKRRRRKKAKSGASSNTLALDVGFYLTVVTVLIRVQENIVSF